MYKWIEQLFCPHDWMRVMKDVPGGWRAYWYCRRCHKERDEEWIEDTTLCRYCGHLKSQHNTAGGFCKHCTCNKLVVSEEKGERDMNTIKNAINRFVCRFPLLWDDGYSQGFDGPARWQWVTRLVYWAGDWAD